MKFLAPRPCLPVIALISFTAALAGNAGAEYAPPELRSIPLSRLLANIEARIEKAPDEPELHHHLARAHAMAYVRELADDSAVELNARGELDQIWFGFEPPHVPYAPGSHHDAGPKKAPGGAAARKGKTALAHLDKAIAAYRQALALEPKNARTIRLGLGWCLKEAGDKEKAIAELREVIEDAWAEEGKAEFGGLRNFVTAEAIGYLMPLLDPEAQAAEVAELRERKKKLEGLPRPITPIAVPLRDGVGAEEMFDPKASVAFDLDGSGDAGREWCWLRPGNAAWLVYDPEGGGQITSGLQLFGNRSFNLFFEHGYDALALLDDDGDGSLRGAELSGLALWHDRDSDGTSSPAEVKRLGECGIVALSYGSELGSDGVRFSAAGAEWSDGRTRPTFDLVMTSNPR